MRKESISAVQLCLLMFTAIIGTAFLTAPTSTANASGLDMWIAPICGLAGGLLCMGILIALHKLYPGQTIVQYANQIAGKFAGSLISLLFLSFTLYTTAYVLRQFTDFVCMSFLPETPPVIIAGSLILVCAAAVYAGVEVICRLSAALVPLPILLVGLIFIPLYTKFTPVLPIFEYGFLPSLKGGFIMQLWFGIFSMASFYIPYVHNRKKLTKWAMISVVFFCGMMVLINWNVVSILGNATSMYHYPFMVVSRYVSFSEFFEHLESVLMMVWAALIFTRLTFGYYAFVIGISQFLKLPDHKPMVLPVGMLIAIISFWGINSSQHGSTVPMLMAAYYILNGLALPLLLLIAAWVRKGLKPSARQSDASTEEESPSV